MKISEKIFYGILIMMILIGVFGLIAGSSNAQSGNVQIDGIDFSTPDSVVVVMPFQMYKDFEKWHNDLWNSTDWAPIPIREFITVVKDD